jgi:anti-sigma factor ChrR (cupin superfamily)
MDYNTSTKGGVDMPAANISIKKFERITVHPAEADRIAGAFGESHAAAEQDLAALEHIAAFLDSGWEGNQKARYLDELNSLTGGIRNILLPQLQLLEKKYQDYSTEITIEDNGTG